MGNTGGKDDSDEFMSGAGLFSDYSELKEDYDDDLDASLKEETKKAAKDHADISCEASVFAEKLPEEEHQATTTAAVKTVTGLVGDAEKTVDFALKCNLDDANTIVKGTDTNKAFEFKYNINPTYSSPKDGESFAKQAHLPHGKVSDFLKTINV